MNLLRLKPREKPEPLLMEIETRRVALVTPMEEVCPVEFHNSMVRMVAQTMMVMPHLHLMPLHFGCSVLPLARQLLALRALEHGATHLLWIDSDMDFPGDALIRLMRHNEAIVGVNYLSKRPPYALTARNAEGEMITRQESTGLEKARSLGFGLVLIAADVFRKLTLPWFQFEWEERTSTFIGEDFYFCKKAIAAGFQPMVDQSLSREIHHVGTFKYSTLLKSMGEPDFL